MADEQPNFDEPREALQAIADAANRALQLGDSIKRVEALAVILDCANGALRRLNEREGDSA